MTTPKGSIGRTTVAHAVSGVARDVDLGTRTWSFDEMVLKTENFGSDWSFKNTKRLNFFILKSSF